MGPDVCTPVVLRLIAGSDWPDSCQAVSEEGHSLIAAGDTLNLVFRDVQGGSVLLTLACTNLDPATGDFDRPITAADVDTIRAGLTLAAEEEGTCSVAYVLTHGASTRTLARGACTLEPEA